MRISVSNYATGPEQLGPVHDEIAGAWEAVRQSQSANAA
jgi:hypothetical protein